MNRKLVVLFAAASLVLCAAETKVQMKDLPEAVRNTVKEQTRNATLKGLAKEVEKGKTFYEAETVVNGKARDILIDANGAVVSVEEAVDLASIPEAAQKALKAAGKVVSVETVTKGSAVYYEGVVLSGGKKKEVPVNADGSPVKD